MKPRRQPPLLWLLLALDLILLGLVIPARLAGVF